jgi:hypothetical protein
MKLLRAATLSAVLMLATAASAETRQVTITAHEPFPVADGAQVVRGVCQGQVAELVLPMTGKPGSVVEWRFGGEQHRNAGLDRLGADLSRSEFLYHYTMRCQPGGRGAVIYATAVSMLDSSNPTYFEARANISPSGIVSDYNGLVGASYSEIRPVLVR